MDTCWSHSGFWCLNPRSFLSLVCLTLLFLHSGIQLAFMTQQTGKPSSWTPHSWSSNVPMFSVCSLFSCPRPVHLTALSVQITPAMAQQLAAHARTPCPCDVQNIWGWLRSPTVCTLCAPQSNVTLHISNLHLMLGGINQ